MFKNLYVQLTSPEKPSGPGKKSMDLRFHIRQTDLAQRWAQLIQKSLPHGIRENHRFVGFCESPQMGIDKGIGQVISLIEKLKPLRPEIDFGVLDFTDVQKEVNRIHVNLVDRHLVKKDLTQKSFQYWSDLNVVLHQLESYLHDVERYSSSFIPRAHFTVTFHYQERQDLTDKDYENAVLNRTFGRIYLAYSELGRHIVELYWGQDSEIPLEHVQLFRKFSSDFSVHLGPSQGSGAHLQLLNQIKGWFDKKEKFFSQIGLSWDPQRLGIGWLPVAYLEGVYDSPSEMRAFQKKVSHFQKIESIEII